MNIGEIGNKFETTSAIDYLSNSTLLDYDYLIIDLDYISNAYGGILSWPQIVRRNGHLSEFINHKQIPLVVFVPKDFYIIVQGKHLEAKSFLPIGELKVTDESGTKLDIIAQTIFSDFFKKYVNLFHYTSYISSPPKSLISTITTPYSKKIIAGYNNEIVFIPRIKNALEDETVFLSDLYSVLQQINKVEEITYPEWTEKYFLPSEKKIVQDIVDINARIAENNLMLETTRKMQDELLSNKVLLIGTGKALENKVEEIFKGIGFNLIPVVEGRDDLIVEYKGKVAVVEIKGVAGSAAEKHAAQLEKWVASYMEEKGSQPKGILLVNAFKDKELSERGEVFPNQMLKYSTTREHCLMSTTQLLGLYYEVVSHPEKKEELIQSLFDTVGVYKGFTDWKKFIEQ